ncbi:prepilin peptidase [Ilumatobacter sp.]|uniref:prepilin peptidase n=1 Tax=Ilumatobacter sp. TaxID=1967498 RepID=UPI0037527CA3
MTAPSQNLLREADAATVLTTRRSVIRSARAIGPLGQSAAIATVITALISALQDGVAAASAISVALLVPAAMVDIVEQRLPNQIIAASALALAIGFVLHSSGVLASNVVLGVALLAGPLLFMHLLSPGSMGFGDVKMALVLGAAVGAVHWQLALVTIALAAGSTATVALLRRMTEISFGPGLVGAAAFSLLAHTLMLTPAALDSTISIGHFA